ncbi:hypothetical protein D8B26_005397 [Coccidioides posadasii str. Silveira]|uniref:uncharacterized protein n=1 Tax=Coccidioides posadasii (strain RMSCC 757 / Silveira) TaxID=443226 RepID=UPI001BEF84FC|nr:hypothetical protein D8B26_005375 [Coccidioides posadasii str. Silveira]QVM10744.1 hypothetical protein D8B26_005397 [Coccidioides posadasii str. Silveira]
MAPARDKQGTVESETKRRRTVFRKFRSLCRDFQLKGLVIVSDCDGKVYCFKNDKNFPSKDLTARLPLITENYDDFVAIPDGGNAERRRKSATRLNAAASERVGKASDFWPPVF